MFPSYAELILPTVGFVYSSLALAIGQVLRDPAQGAELQTFLVLCALVSLGFLGPALFMTYRRVTWWKRWAVYLISGVCLSLLALSAYD